MSAIDVFSRLMQSTQGKDKILKFGQYFFRLVVSAIENIQNKSPQLAELEKKSGLLERELSDSRKALRLLRFFTEFNMIWNSEHCGDDVGHFLPQPQFFSFLLTQLCWRMKQATHILRFLFYLMDHLIWLSRIKVLRLQSKSYTRCKRMKNMTSLFALCVSIWRGSRLLFDLQKKQTPSRHRCLTRCCDHFTDDDGIHFQGALPVHKPDPSLSYHSDASSPSTKVRSRKTQTQAGEKEKRQRSTGQICCNRSFATVSIFPLLATVHGDPSKKFPP